MADKEWTKCDQMVFVNYFMIGFGIGLFICLFVFIFLTLASAN